MDLPAVADVINDPSIFDWDAARPDQVWAVLSGVVAWASGKGTKDAWRPRGAAGRGGDHGGTGRGRGGGAGDERGDARWCETACVGAQVQGLDDRCGSGHRERGVIEVRALTADEWRRLRLARMAAVETMPYYARALFALVPVAADGLGTFAVDKHMRLYVDPKMLGTSDGWDIPTAGAVLLHEVGHVLREHAVRADAMDAPVDRQCWNIAADAEINDDLLAAGLGLPRGGHPRRHRMPGRPRRRGLLPASGAARCARTPQGDPATATVTVARTASAAALGQGISRCPVNCPQRWTWAAERACLGRLRTWCGWRWRVPCRPKCGPTVVRGAARCQRGSPGGQSASSPRLWCRGRKCCALRCGARSRTRRARCITRGGDRTGVPQRGDPADAAGTQDHR